jgi:glutamate-ammonia-ligase adenylyltransferase
VDRELSVLFLSYGSFLPRVLRSHPDLLSPEVRGVLYEGGPALGELVRVSPEEQNLEEKLRTTRNRAVALLIIGQVLGILPIEEVLALYSEWAVQWISTACSAVYEDLARRWPPPRKENREPVRYTVFALGKLGAMELNLSSDVDLIFVVEELSGRTVSGDTTQITDHTFWDRWARGVIELLQSVKENGFVFRVDVRLRPGGNQSPLVQSYGQVLDYYTNYSTVSERLALLRARPIAGDLELGNLLLQELDPILFPRHLNFEVLDEIRWLKGKIDREAVRTRRKGEDIKLGPGGIRELEFLLHTLAMVYGGKTPDLKVQRTLELINALAKNRLLPQGTAVRLREAYLFLRGVENLLQVRDDRQTYLLPQDPSSLAEIAYLFGYRGEKAVKRFLEDLHRHRGLIEQEFSALVQQPSSRESNLMPVVYDLVEGFGEEEGELERLPPGLPFSDPEGAKRHLNRLLSGPRPDIYGKRTRVQFERALPILLEEVIQSEDPDQALRRLREFVDRVGGRSYVYALLGENPEVARALIRLFAGSELLGKYLTDHPELMDTLVLRGYALPYRDRTSIHQEIQRIAKSSPDPWEVAEELRSFQNQEILRIALNDLHGSITPLEVMEQLSDLAEEILITLLEVSPSLLRTRPSYPLYPVALGKLGSREMMYGSDLDLLFIIDPRSDEGTEGHVAWAQKLLTLLSTRTARGTLYPVDLRLRPSGNQGLLVSTFPAFQEYHRRLASIWERVALVYHRVIHPSPPEEIRSFLLTACYGAGLTGEDLQKMVEIRKKMEEERGGKEPLKAGPGGVADIEFGLALLAIHAVSRKTFPPAPSPWKILLQAEMVFPELQEILHLFRAGLLFYRVIMNRLRLIAGRPLNALPEEPSLFRKLALSLAMEPGDLKSLAERIPQQTRKGWEGLLAYLRREIS